MLGRKPVIFLSLFLLAACTPPAPAMPTDLVIQEYRLVGAPDISTDRLKFQFAEGNQEEVLKGSESERDIQKQTTENNNRKLAPFGYRLQDSTLYKGDEVIASNILFMSPVSVNASGTNFISHVEMYDGTYEFSRDHFEKLPWPPGREPDAYVGDRLLSVETSGQLPETISVNVYLDDQRIYQSEMVEGLPTYGPIDGPWGYDGHWAVVLLDAKPDPQGKLEMASRVIQDGQDLNTKNGYDQSFQFAVLKDHPFYFFQRNGKISISFDGQEIAKGYDEIPHYNCCSGALLNPGISMNMIWFFARRGKDWYYVEVSLPQEKTNHSGA